MILVLYRDRRKKKDRPLGMRIAGTDNSWDLETLTRQKNKDTGKVEDVWSKKGYYRSVYSAMHNAVDILARAMDVEGFVEARKRLDKLAAELERNLMGKLGDLKASVDVAATAKKKKSKGSAGKKTSP